MIVVFLGPPGAGKGTQCKRLVDRYGLAHLSSGDTLRRERQQGTALGQKAQAFMDKGALVPDDLIVAMMIKEMESHRSGGFVLDGFPRTVGQARELDAALVNTHGKIDAVLNLKVDDAKLELRVTGRRSCPRCGEAYHIVFNAPAKENCCNKCGTALVQRPDDTAEVVRHRIQTYHEQTSPLVSYYQQKGLCVDIDGNVGIEQVTQALFKALDRMNAASA